MAREANTLIAMATALSGLSRFVHAYDAAAAPPPFLRMSVGAHVRTLCTSLKLPRQVVSDKKWEGESWLGVRKRPRDCTVDAPDTIATDACAKEACEKDGRPACPASPPASGSSSDEDDEADDSDEEQLATHVQKHNGKRVAARASARKKKDKDVVPSKTRWEWDAGASAWKRVERPRLHAAGVFFSFTMLPPKHLDLLRALLKDPACPLTEAFLRTELIPRLNREHTVSLRALDWLMVDYACENNVAYLWPDAAGTLRVVNVHDKYARLLKCWRRRRFDCFRRRHRIYFELDGKTFSTTVAQLHFFFVAHAYGFLEYTRQHLAQIDAHMKETLTRNQQTKRAQANASKRQALVHKARPCMLVSNVPSTMSFAFPDMA